MPPQYSFPIPSVYCLEILDCFPQMWLIRHFLYSIIHSKHSSRTIPSFKRWHFLCVFMCAVNVISQVTAVAWGHFMTAGPVEEGVTQEKQTVITALCPALPSLTLALLTLLYIS